MIKRIAGCLIAAVTLLFSCTVVPQKSSVAHTPYDIPEWFNTDSLRAAYLYTEGVRVIAESGVDSIALPYFRKVLEVDSLHAPTHHYLSLLSVETDPSEAIQHSLVAHAADTANIDYLGQLAYAQTIGGQHKTALHNFNKLLRLDSRNPYNYRMTAALYTATQMPYMAIAVLDSAEYKLGLIPELWNDKRNLLIDVKLYDRAIEETQSMIANHPFEVDNYRILGELYAKTGRDSLAMASFDKAVEIAPTTPTILLGAARYYFSRGNEIKYLSLIQTLFEIDNFDLTSKLSLYDSLISDIDFYKRNFFSINTLSSLLRIKHPDSYEVTDRYATHQIRAGELDKALETYKSVVASGERVPIDAYIAVVDIESYLGRRDSALLYLNKAIELFPTNSDLHLYRAYELQKSNATEKEVVGAFKGFLKIATDEADKSRACASLGDYYFELGKPKPAFRWYEKALQHNPDNALVLNNWAYFVSEMIDFDTQGNSLGSTQIKELERSLEMSKRACELSPSNAIYIDTQAWILHLLGRNEEAKPLMKQAISLDNSGDDTLLFHYAEILAALGDNFMAETYYNRSLKAGGDRELIESRIAALKENK